jgi:ribosomal protein L37E
MTAAGQGHDGPTVRVVVTRCHWCGRTVRIDDRGYCRFCGWPRDVEPKPPMLIGVDVEVRKREAG